MSLGRPVSVADGVQCSLYTGLRLSQGQCLTEDEGAGDAQSVLVALAAMETRQQMAQAAMKAELQAGQA